MRIFAIIVLFSVFFSLLSISQQTQHAYSRPAEFYELRSEHFIIKYQQGVDKNYVLKIKNKAETFYRTVTQEFNLIRDELWLWDKRAKIFIAKDKKSYLNDFSCSAWSGACVNYQQKVIYTYPDQQRFSSILIHELTHIIFHERVGRRNLPLWVDEGVATYMENKQGGGLYSKQVGILKSKIQTNNYIKLSDLDKITLASLQGKPLDEVNLFYLESFSIVNFLISRYGEFKFSDLLSKLKEGHSFPQALSKTFYQLRSLEDLEKQWKKFYQS